MSFYKLLIKASFYCPIDWLYARDEAMSSYTVLSSWQIIRLQLYEGLCDWVTVNEIWTCMNVCSVVSDSLWSHGGWPTRFLCHKISQAGILDRVAISFSRVSAWSRNGTRISCVFCISRKILYHCTTWVALECGQSDASLC